MALDDEHPVIQQIGDTFQLNGFRRVPASEAAQDASIFIDGVGLVTGDRLEWYKTDDGTELAVAQNGRYVVTAVGSEASTFVLTKGQKNAGVSMSAAPFGEQPNRRQRRAMRFNRNP